MESERMKQYRPRLTQKELRFIVDSLKAHQKFCKERQKEAQSHIDEIKSLEREVKLKGSGPEYDRLKELRKENHFKQRQDYHTFSHVADILRQRFELLLQGERRYTGEKTAWLLGTVKE